MYGMCSIIAKFYMNEQEFLLLLCVNLLFLYYDVCKTLKNEINLSKKHIEMYSVLTTCSSHQRFSKTNPRNGFKERMYIFYINLIISQNSSTAELYSVGSIRKSTNTNIVISFDLRWCKSTGAMKDIVWQKQLKSYLQTNEIQKWKIIRHGCIVSRRH